MQIVQGLVEGVGQAPYSTALQLGAQLVQTSLGFARDLDHILLALGNRRCRDA